MKPDFVAFPRTCHIYGSQKFREDLQLSEEETSAFLSQGIIVQEKIDGANVGLRLSQSGGILYQNRGEYVEGNEVEVRKLPDWVHSNEVQLRKILSGRVLFGEWMFSRHSVEYNALPSYFIAVDMFDINEDRFLSQRAIADTLDGSNIVHIPTLHKYSAGEVTLVDDLEKLLSRSAYGTESMEGLYLRFESDKYNEARAKYVRSGFQQSIKTHWKKLPFQANKSIHPVEKFWSN